MISHIRVLHRISSRVAVKLSGNKCIIIEVKDKCPAQIINYNIK